MFSSKTKCALLWKRGKVSSSRRLDMFYVGLLIYMVNLNYYILKKGMFGTNLMYNI
jgi:hypothetical protein